MVLSKILECDCPSTLLPHRASQLLNTELIIAAGNRVRYQEAPRTPQTARESPLDSWEHPSFLEIPGQDIHDIRNNRSQLKNQNKNLTYMGPCCLPQKKNYIYQQSQPIVKSNFKKKQQIPQWAVR